MDRREARDKCLTINQSTWATGVSAEIVRTLPENEDPPTDTDNGWDVEIKDHNK